MWAMSRAQRVTAARHGQFTLGEMLRWASRLPDEVPLVNGELFFITALARTPMKGWAEGGQYRTQMATGWPLDGLSANHVGAVRTCAYRRCRAGLWIGALAGRIHAADAVA